MRHLKDCYWFNWLHNHPVPTSRMRLQPTDAQFHDSSCSLMASLYNRCIKMEMWNLYVVYVNDYLMVISSWLAKGLVSLLNYWAYCKSEPICTLHWCRTCTQFSLCLCLQLREIDLTCGLYNGFDSRNVWDGNTCNTSRKPGDHLPIHLIVGCILLISNIMDINSDPDPSGKLSVPGPRVHQSGEPQCMVWKGSGDPATRMLRASWVCERANNPEEKLEKDCTTQSTGNPGNILPPNKSTPN